jgi:excisionase family DNA binding protein
MDMDPVLYTVTEAAELLKVNRNSVYDLLKNNVIRGLKLGSLKITRTELIKFLEENNGKDLSNLEDIKDLTFDREE